MLYHGLIVSNFQLLFFMLVYSCLPYFAHIISSLTNDAPTSGVQCIQLLHKKRARLEQKDGSGRTPMQPFGSKEGSEFLLHSKLRGVLMKCQGWP